MDRTILAECLQQHRLVDVRFDHYSTPDLRGYIVRLSERFVVLAKAENGEFDGLSIFLIEDVTFLRWGEARLQAWDRLTRAAARPGLDVDAIALGSWEEAVSSLASRVPLISFHRDGVSSASAYIGRSIRIEGGCVVAEQVTPEGAVDGEFALLLEDLTRVEVLGRYEQGLARLLGAA